MPNLDDPFTLKELRGFFKWDEQLTETLSQQDRWMYIAMHEKKLARGIRKGKLGLSCTYDYLLGKEKWEDSCIWLSMQAWHEIMQCNHFGPFVVHQSQCS